MKLVVTSVDYAPEDLYDQTPFNVSLLRQLPGTDRPDYWLGELEVPLNWLNENQPETVSHIILAARWAGTQIEPHVENLPINIAYVTNSAQLEESSVDFAKSIFMAIGIATEVEGGNKPKPLAHIFAGKIARAFGVGNNE